MVIDEIVGARSTLNNGFYRGKVLKEINDTTYVIHYIDFGDTDNVPVSSIFEIPNDFMVIYYIYNNFILKKYLKFLLILYINFENHSLYNLTLFMFV